MSRKANQADGTVHPGRSAYRHRPCRCCGKDGGLHLCVRIQTYRHRLSTVKNADQLVVIEGGKIIETGTHTALIDRKGAYYHLVKNQLELGN